MGIARLTADGFEKLRLNLCDPGFPAAVAVACPSPASMTLDQFWKIVEDVHRTSGGDMDKKCELLDAELRRLPLEEVRSFHAHFYECFDRAFSWELWAAAYIIGGGCSDDKFSDFRSTLISMGRQTFERALADPQSLADIDYRC